MIFICPDDGIGIRVGLRSQILRVRVSLGAPFSEYGEIGKLRRFKIFRLGLPVQVRLLVPIAPVDKLAKSSLSKGEIQMWVQLPPGVPLIKL
jgi:hypothetical protein